MDPPCNNIQDDQTEIHNGTDINKDNADNVASNGSGHHSDNNGEDIIGENAGANDDDDYFDNYDSVTLSEQAWLVEQEHLEMEDDINLDANSIAKDVEQYDDEEQEPPEDDNALSSSNNFLCHPAIDVTPAVTLKVPKLTKKQVWERSQKWKGMKGNGIFWQDSLEEQLQSNLLCKACIENMIAGNRVTKDVNLSNAMINVKATNFTFTCILLVQCCCGTHLFRVEPMKRNNTTLDNTPSMGDKKKGASKTYK